MKERIVYISLQMRRKPWREGGCFDYCRRTISFDARTFPCSFRCDEPAFRFLYREENVANEPIRMPR